MQCYQYVTSMLMVTTSKCKIQYDKCKCNCNFNSDTLSVVKNKTKNNLMILTQISYYSVLKYTCLHILCILKHYIYSTKHAPCQNQSKYKNTNGNKLKTPTPKPAPVHWLASCESKGEKKGWCMSFFFFFKCVSFTRFEL